MPKTIHTDIDKLSSDDEEWFAANVPAFECPDPIIEQIYNFRWSVFRKHLRQTPEGWIVTEFLPDVSWSGTYNTIAVAAPMHIYEGRWLRDSKPLDDYSRFWFGASAEPRRYSAALADAIWARAQVSGDKKLASDLLPALVANYKAWERTNQGDNGLFWQVDDREGEELTIGGSGYRVPINCYQFADAAAIGAIARNIGDISQAQQFSEKASKLKSAIQELLWDSESRFFKTRTCKMAVEAHNRIYRDWIPGNVRTAECDELVNVREIFGFLPWAYLIPDPGYEDAWGQLFDPNGFTGRFGPPTAERRHPHYMAVQPHDCAWNGPSWPFATTQLLRATANLIRHYDQDVVTGADYFRQLRIYASSHYRRADDGSKIPWIDESLHPDTGEWLTRASLAARQSPDWDRGRDYNHSGFCDLIISGLIGLCPNDEADLIIAPLLPPKTWDYWRLDRVPYQGQLLTIVFDSDGSRFGHGTGLLVKENNGPYIKYVTKRTMRLTK